LRGTDVEDILNQVGAHAGKEESAQKWIDANLAGTGNFGEEGDDAGAEFAQVARKLIGAGQVLELTAAGENVESKLRQGKEKLVEFRADQGRGLLGIEAGAGME
jgi:hypothetical protein